jgi:hypothetical protein
MMAGFFLNGIFKMVSRCCKQEVFALVEYYACSRCHFPCDIVCINIHKDNAHELRHESQIENAFN